MKAKFKLPLVATSEAHSTTWVLCLYQSVAALAAFSVRAAKWHQVGTHWLIAISSCHLLFSISSLSSHASVVLTWSAHLLTSCSKPVSNHRFPDFWVGVWPSCSACILYFLVPWVSHSLLALSLVQMVRFQDRKPGSEPVRTPDPPGHSDWFVGAHVTQRIEAGWVLGTGVRASGTCSSPLNLSRGERELEQSWGAAWSLRVRARSWGGAQSCPESESEGMVWSLNLARLKLHLPWSF